MYSKYVLVSVTEIVAILLFFFLAGRVTAIIVS